MKNNIIRHRICQIIDEKIEHYLYCIRFSKKFAKFKPINDFFKNYIPLNVHSIPGFYQIFRIINSNKT